jgi:hypothetical protein
VSAVVLVLATDPRTVVRVLVTVVGAEVGAGVAVVTATTAAGWSGAFDV